MRFEEIEELEAELAALREKVAQLSAAVADHRARALHWQQRAASLEAELRRARGKG